VLRQDFNFQHRAYGSAERVTNARLKVYLGKTTLQVANSPIFSTAAWEKSILYDKTFKARAGSSVPGAEPFSDESELPDLERSAFEARRRAKSKVRDIALCNRFQYMFTWTLDPKKVDRYSPEEVYRRVRPFLSNATQRKGFSYVVIPEYHTLKTGEDRPAIHFHGLCSLGDVRIERSMKRGHPRFDKSGRPVFNMVDWDFGWSTVVPLDENYERAVNYVTKYISKQNEKILGKYYLSSRSLKKSPDIVPLERIPFEQCRDSALLLSGEQHECSVYRDIKILSQDFKKDGAWDGAEE